MFLEYSSPSQKNGKEKVSSSDYKKSKEIYSEIFWGCVVVDLNQITRHRKLQPDILRNETDLPESLCSMPRVRRWGKAARGILSLQV